MLTRAIGQLLMFSALFSILNPQSTQPRLKRVVGVAGEHGVVALNGNALSVFSPAIIQMQDPTNHQWKIVDKKSGAVSIRVDDTRWRELATPLPISSAYEFALCDHLNQVDMRSTDSKVQSVLPGEAKLKSLERISDNLTLAVYSVSTDAVQYDIRVGIMQNKPGGGYSLLEDDLVTDAGNFCGVLRGEGNVFFIFADEPSGSSNFSAVYVYAITAGHDAK